MTHEQHDTATLVPAWSSAPAAPRLPGRWRLVERAGQGGQGEVWRAEDRVLSETVALKLIPRAAGDVAAERARREVRLGRNLQHPHLVRVHDLVETPTHLVVVMEWLAGGSLRERVAAGVLAVEEVVVVARQTLEALAVLHAAGVVHRDVKPSNLLLAGDGSIRLGDLGLVRHASDPELTGTGLAVGTPATMSPEQLRGREVGPPSDLYALGVTLYTLLTGQGPFEGSDFVVADAHLHRRPTRLRSRRPDCPRWLDAFVGRLLAKHPDDRWPDAAAALAALERRRSFPWRLAARRAAVAAAVLPAVGLGGWYATGALQADPAAVLITGSEAVVVDSDGAELWRTVEPGSPAAPTVVDLLGSPRPEVVLVTTRHDPETAHRTAALRVFAPDGDLLAEVPVAGHLFSRTYPEMTDAVHFGELLTADLRGGGHPELVWHASHPEWFGSLVESWDAGTGLRGHFVHSGHIREVRAVDLDGDGRRELVAVGVNNRIGYQRVVAVLSGAAAAGRSPDLLLDTDDPSTGTLLSYVPLGQATNDARIAAAGPDGIVLQAPDGEVRLTRWGLPASAGLDLPPERIVGFWAELGALGSRAALAGGVPETALTTFEQDQSELLDLPPFRTAAVLLLARAAAAAGRPDQAIELLERTTGELPDYGDLWLRLGELRLIRGELDAGAAALVRSVDPPRPGRTKFDVLLLLGTAAAVADRPDLDRLARSLDRAPGPEVTVSHTTLLGLFCRGRWDDPALDEGPVDRTARVGRVLQRWAALERGAEPGEIAAWARTAAEHPELTIPARLLQAAALLRAGRPDRALGVTRQALARADERGRTSYPDFAWIPLAEWLYGAALLELGEPEAARPHLERSAAIAPRTWFGEAAARALGR